MMWNFEQISAVVFLLLICLYIILNKKRFKLQKIISIGKLPLVYIALMRTQLGVALMEKWGRKYKELIKFAGYCGIGFAAIGLLFVFFSLFQNIYTILTKEQAVNGIQLAIPGLNLPGIGILSFWHWIISIFILAMVHEFSHGIVAAAHNLKVKNSGPAVFGILLPLIPAAYVEPDEKELEKRDDIVKYSIFAAGPISNIILGLLLFLILGLIFTPFEKAMSDPIGFSFKSMNESYPSWQYFKEPIVLNKINGKNVDNAQPFVEEMFCVKPGQNVTFANDKNSYSLNAVQNPENKNKGFIGVTDIKNERKWKNEMFGKIFAWFKGLFTWMALLNIFIGIANLLPLGPVDGGLILKTFLHRMCKRKENAIWWFGFISLTTLLLIIAGLALPYLVNF